MSETERTPVLIDLCVLLHMPQNGRYLRGLCGVRIRWSTTVSRSSKTRRFNLRTAAGSAFGDAISGGVGSVGPAYSPSMTSCIRSRVSTHTRTWSGGRSAWSAPEKSLCAIRRPSEMVLLVHSCIIYSWYISKLIKSVQWSYVVVVFANQYRFKIRLNWRDLLSIKDLISTSLLFLFP